MLKKNKLSLLKDAACMVLSFSVLANCFDGSFTVYKAKAASVNRAPHVSIIKNGKVSVYSPEVFLRSLNTENLVESVEEDGFTILNYVTDNNLSEEELFTISSNKASADIYLSDLAAEKEENAEQAKDNAEKAAYEASLVKNPDMVIALTYDELDLLERLVECEAGNQDMIGRILVANTIINRYNSPKFPNNISEIILWPGQYSPVSSGHINTITVSEMSKEAVQRALTGEDYSKNAFYFMNRRYSCASSIRWFDTLPKVVEHQDHEFFTEY